MSSNCPGLGSCELWKFNKSKLHGSYHQEFTTYWGSNIKTETFEITRQHCRSSDARQHGTELTLSGIQKRERGVKARVFGGGHCG